MWTVKSFFTCSLRGSLLSVNSTTVGSASGSVRQLMIVSTAESCARAPSAQDNTSYSFLRDSAAMTSRVPQVQYSTWLVVVLTSRGLATDRHFLVRFTNTNEFETGNDGIHQRCPNVLIKNVATRRLSALRGLRFATVDLSFLLSYFSVYRVCC